MHNNYYFLRHVSRELESRLTGTVISECFSQQKDELVLRFEKHTTSFYIKATLVPSLSCLSFPENFQRARKNSVDLFERIIGERVQNVTQFNNERSFAFNISNKLTLLFKMHGNRSNVILFDNGSAFELFKKNIPADLQLRPETLHREIDWSYENFITHQPTLRSVYFTFGKLVWSHLADLGFDDMATEKKWQLLQQVQQELNAGIFYITVWNNTPALSLLKLGNLIKQLADPLKAANEFYYTFTQVFALQQEKTAALAALQHKLDSGKSYYTKTEAKLQELLAVNNYKVWADLLMANLHAVSANAEKVTLLNFYNNNAPVEIKLKKDLNAQKNAAVYYRKAKNQQIEINRLQQALDQKEKEISRLQMLLREVADSGNLKSLRTLVGEEDLQPQGLPPAAALLPYHEFTHSNFKIWVGKNAQGNDVLTFRYGYKEDLWLHAKDVPGSHVLIKHQAGKNFPKDVIERAAELAAYNSKRRNETLCPVIVTPRKYVRKRKGDPAGAVVVEREEVIMVEPKS